MAAAGNVSDGKTRRLRKQTGDWNRPNFVLFDPSVGRYHAVQLRRRVGILIFDSMFEVSDSISAWKRLNKIFKKCKSVRYDI
jgi:hypothetical protein